MFARFTLGLAPVLLILNTIRSAEPAKEIAREPLPSGAVARLGTLAFRLATSDQSHGSLVFSHDGKRLAAYETGKVHIWDAETGKTVRQFDYPYPPGYVEPVAISADGKRVIVFNANSGVQGWDVESGEVLFSHDEIGRSRASMGIGFLADGTPAYTRNFTNEDGNFVALHDAKTKKELAQFKGELGHSFAMDISPDGKILNGGMFDRANECVHVRLYDAKTFELKKSLDNVAKGEGVTVAGSCADGSVLLIVTTNGDICFYNSEDGTLLSKIEDKPVDCDHPVPAALSWEGKFAAISGYEDGTLRLFDTANGKLLKKLDGAGKGGYVVVSKDGKRIAHRGTHSVQIWDATTGTQLHRDLPAHKSPPTAVCYSADGKKIASAADGEIILWDAATKKLLAKWAVPHDEKKTSIDRLRFSADGKHLVASGMGQATLWDAATKKLLREWKAEEMHHADFHPDGKSLYVASSDGKLERWDLKELKVVESNHEALDDTHEFVLTPGGDRLILASNEGIAFYDSKTLKNVGSVPRDEGSRYVGVTPDPTDRRVAAIKDADFGWTSIEPGTNRSSSGETLSQPGLEMQSFAASRTLFAAYFGSGPLNPRGLGIDPEAAGTLTLLDRATGKVRKRMALPFSQIRSLSFSPDGRYLATANSDTTILIWDTWNLPDPVEEGATPDAKDLDALWNLLADGEIDATDRTLRAMTGRPEAALNFLKSKLHASEKPADETLKKLLDQLESNRFAVREKASKELQRIGASAIPELRKRRDTTTSEEVRSRLDAILSVVDSPFLSGETLKAYRGVELLRRIGNTEANELLGKLAKSESDAVLTREAKAAIGE